MNTQSSDVNIRHSARARRMTLRVSELDGRATLTVPRGTSDRAAKTFLNDNSTWLDRARSRVPDIIVVAAGIDLPVEGRMLPVRAGLVKTAKFLEDHIVAPENNTGAALRVALKFAAKTRLDDAVSRYAARVGGTVNRITLRDTRSRWGSCSGRGNLMFSWRLIMAPPDVLKYVAAHEVAHLQEMNHSPAFWALVERLFPDYKSMRPWLRSDGIRLHRYRFD